MKTLIFLMCVFLNIGLFAQSISSISPTSANAGQTLNVTITGSNTHFQSGSSTCYFRIYQGSSTNIYANSTNVSSNTAMTANFTIPANAQNGIYDLIVYNNYDYYIYKYSCFNIIGAQLVSITPSSANAGQQNLSVTITGNNTQFIQGSSCNISIYFGNTNAIINSVTPQNDTIIFASISIPSNVFTGFYSINYNNGANQYLTLVNGFYINGITPPEIVSVTPNSAYIGESLDVTITGANCHFQQGSATQVYFYGQGSGSITVSNIYAVDNNTLHAFLNISNYAYTGFYNLQLYNYTDGVITKSNVFQVKQASILSISPTTGTNGQNLDVTITGDHTHFIQGSCTVNFGFLQGSGTVNVSVLNSTSLTANVTIPANTQTGNYYVSVYSNIDGYLYSNTSFHVDGIPPPTISTVSPNLGYRGESLDVTITGTNCHFQQGSTTQVSFYGQGSGSIVVSNIFAVDNNTLQAHIDISSWAYYGYYDVYLYNNIDGGIYKDNTFQVKAPSLSSINPNTGLAGQNLDVTITGDHTHFIQGSCTVNFEFLQGSSITNVTVNSGTSLTANVTIPSNTYTGNYEVSVYNSGEGTIYYNDYFYVEGIPMPSISDVSPDHGLQGETLDVTITGVNTHFGSGSSTTIAFDTYDLNGIIVNSVQVLNSQTITANISIGSSSSSSYYDVIVYNSIDGALEKYSGFKVGAGIITINPSTANPGSTINIVVTAYYTHFTQSTNTVYFVNINSYEYLYPNTVTVIDNVTLSLNITIPSSKTIEEYGLVISNSIDGDLYLPDLLLTVGTAVSELFSSKVQNLLVYPNPVSNSANIIFESECKEFKIELYNCQGVKSFETIEKGYLERKKKIVLNFENMELSVGIYFIKVMTDKETYFSKVIFQK